MRKIIEKIKNLDTHRVTHIALRVVFVAFAMLVVYRFVMFGLMQRRDVFNMARDANANGLPVNVIKMQQTDGVIYEPLFINNNRGYVSSMRVARFAPGQKISDGGEIVSVSTSIDLDSGMHIVRTRGATNGAHTVEIKEKGFYVPTYAVQNGVVFVVRNGVAHGVPVSIVRGDAKNTLIKGVSNDDIIITSHIGEGALIKIVK